MVSIHAPREGCDLHVVLELSLQLSFNSRTPGGVRRSCAYCRSRRALVSIHAPREGCDNQMLIYRSNLRRFNSRTPGGVRHLGKYREIAVGGFNSRTPGGVRRTQ